MKEQTKKDKIELSPDYNRNISQEMRTSFLDYSMSVIVARALPDARDGLKPVHRRILYALSTLGMTHDKPYKKSARIVGEIIGKYHPHGDTAVYDTMVRMSQDFSYRYPLVDGHGNFGSIDGDSAAAMRYTESRMSKLAGELCKDLNKKTVNFVDNYDGAEQEPVVLPSYFPNLLVNGSVGIAVGMATSIPSHNLNEIIDAIEHVAKNPECEILSILDFVKGPDFPTGAIILGQNAYKNAYLTGKSIIKIRSKTKLEKLANNKFAIIITEIPYQVNKTNLINNIVEAVKDKKVENITDLRDESNREGIRIVLEIKNEALAGLILNQLYKFTSLQTSFTMNLLALHEGQPKLMNLKEMIEIYIEHQILMINNKSKFELARYKAQGHIIEGLVNALGNIDYIIRLIKESGNSSEAVNRLSVNLFFSVDQAKAILEMKLQRLTGLEKEKLKKELETINNEIEKLEKLLSSRENQVNHLIKSLKKLKYTYGDERRTQITEVDEEEIIDEALIQEEKVVITLSKSGYIKRLPLDTYRVQNRGGVGIKASNNANTEDDIDKVLVVSTHSDLLIFSNKGKVYRIRAHKVPVYSRTAKGMPIINLINIEKNETIKTIINLQEYKNHENLFFCTKQGVVKRSRLKEFISIRSNGKIALNLKDDDELVDVVRTTGENEIIIAASNGRAVRFSEKKVRLMGRTASGVKGMNINLKTTEIVGICTNEDADFILSISEKGFGKISPFEDYRLSNRGGKGVISMRTNEKTGKLLTIKSLNNTYSSSELLIITLKGIIIRLLLENIRTTGRNTSGVKLIRLKSKDDTIASTQIIAPEYEDETNNNIGV